MPALKVTVVLLNDNYASTSIGPIEVFQSAGSLWNRLTRHEPEPGFDVQIVSLDGGSVRSASGVEMTPGKSIRSVRRTDVIIVPASGLDLDAQFERHAALLPWLRRWHARGARVAGICSGAAYLAEAGLLDGRQATTHWGAAELCARRYPQVDWRTDKFITEDNGVLCSGGVYAAIDLSLYLVDKFCGHRVALQCAKALLVDMPRTHQSGYALLPLSRPHSDERIRSIEDYMQRSFARELPIERLAERASMSARNFVRRFQAATGQMPGQYLQSLRIAVARELLEEGVQSVQEVCTAVGYEDLAFFRTLFRRHTGMTPREYRNRFGRPAARSDEPAADGGDW